MRSSPTKSRRKRTRINGCVFPGRATRVQLPNSLPFLNGFLKPANTSWQYLSKSKIVIQPQAESLFDLVYLIRTLWAWDKTHQNNYSMVVLRNKEIITDEFLKVAKRKLGILFESRYSEKRIKHFFIPPF